MTKVIVSGRVPDRDKMPSMSIDKKILRPITFPGLIRVGRKRDGGYVVPRSIVDSINVLLSFGVFDDWSFEEGIRSLNPNTKIEAYDNSVGPSVFRTLALKGLLKTILVALIMNFKRVTFWWNECITNWKTFNQYRDFFQEHNKAIHFKKNVWTFSDERNVTPAQIFERLRASNQSVSALIKMDIECSEYVVMDQILQFSDSINCMVVEFHEIDRRVDFNKCILSILQNFSIVHIHGNNCMPINECENFPVMVEVTFINNKLLGSLDAFPLNMSAYPIAGLDLPNCPAEPDYQLNLD